MIYIKLYKLQFIMRKFCGSYFIYFVVRGLIISFNLFLDWSVEQRLISAPEIPLVAPQDPLANYQVPYPLERELRDEVPQPSQLHPHNLHAGKFVRLGISKKETTRCYMMRKECAKHH